MISVLIIEDEAKVLHFLQEGLEHSHFLATGVDTLDQADFILGQQSFDVVILDRLVHGKDSLAHLGRFKKLAPSARFIVLSALSDVDQRVRGLELGVDDYLGKPFHLREVIARIHTVLRRHEPDKDSTHIVVGHLTLNLESQEAAFAGQRVDLTAKEFKILSTLAARPKKIFSREELLDRVWGINSETDASVVEVAMARLRAKLATKKAACPIKTKRGVGYYLSADPAL